VNRWAKDVPQLKRPKVAVEIQSASLGKGSTRCLSDENTQWEDKSMEEKQHPSGSGFHGIPLDNI